MRGTAPRAGGRLEIEPLRLAWEQAGTLTIAAQVDGVPGTPPPGAPVDPEATAMQFAAARLAGLRLTLRDQGLLGRVLAQQARAQRIPEARLREQWAQMALAMPMPGARPAAPAPARDAGPAGKGKGSASPTPRSGSASGGSADSLVPMRQALASFIRQPGTIEITLRPPQPLPFLEMGDLGGNPAEAVQRLGLTVVAR
jgi:hypothetical protein